MRGGPLFARSFVTLRSALAVLALLGQLAPLVAFPVCALAAPRPGGGCASAACACAPVEKALAGCCCSKTEVPVPAPKSCCDAPAKSQKKASCCAPATSEPLAPVAKVAPDAPKAVIKSGGSCRCDKPTKAATAEPAVPPSEAPAVAVGQTSEALKSRWVPLLANEPLPPPYPPPRAG